MKALKSLIMVSTLVLAFAIGAPAKSVENRAVTETLKFSHPTIVNGTALPPAEYRMVAERNELKVEDLNHKVLAESPITWKRLNHRVRATKMDIDRGVLTKVTLSGTHEAVLLHRSHPES